MKKLLIALVFMFMFQVGANATEFEIINHKGCSLNKKQVEKVFHKTAYMTEISVDVGKITVEVFPTKGDLFAKYQMLYGAHGGFKSWYDVERKTVYISTDNFSEKTLAHEFTHVLLYEVTSPKDKSENLPNWVEENY